MLRFAATLKYYPTIRQHVYRYTVCRYMAQLTADVLSSQCVILSLTYCSHCGFHYVDHCVHQTIQRLKQKHGSTY